MNAIGIKRKATLILKTPQRSMLMHYNQPVAENFGNLDTEKESRSLSRLINQGLLGVVEEVDLGSFN